MTISKFPEKPQRGRPRKAAPSKSTGGDEDDWGIDQDNSEFAAIAGDLHRPSKTMARLVQIKDDRKAAVWLSLKAGGLGPGAIIRNKLSQEIYKLSEIEVAGPSATLGIVGLIGQKINQNGDCSRTREFIGMPNEFQPT